MTLSAKPKPLTPLEMARRTYVVHAMRCFACKGKCEEGAKLLDELLGLREEGKK
jgi:hypothetical protein